MPAKKQADKTFVLERYPQAKVVRRQIHAGTKLYGWVVEGCGALPIAPQQRGEDAAWSAAADAIRMYR